MFWWDSTTSSPVLGFIFLRVDGWKKEPRKVDECTWRDRITVTNIKHCRRHQPRTIWHMVEIKTTQVVWINSENYKSYGGSPINISKQSSEDERFLIRVGEERDERLLSMSSQRFVVVFHVSSSGVTHSPDPLLLLSTGSAFLSTNDCIRITFWYDMCHPFIQHRQPAPTKKASSDNLVTVVVNMTYYQRTFGEGGTKSRTNGKGFFIARH